MHAAIDIPSPILPRPGTRASSFAVSPVSPASLRRVGQTLSFAFALPSTHARLFEDQVADHERWSKLRNAAWRHRVEPLVCMRVALGFVWQLVYILVISIIVGLLHDALQASFPVIGTFSLAVPMGMISFALSLLLVFRTNSSFSRWWEARIIWGQVVNFGRNFSRQVLLWYPADQPQLAEAALRWSAAAPHILRAHVRQNGDVQQAAEHILLREEVVWLGQWSNAPLGAGAAMAALTRAAGMPPELEAVLQEQVQLYCNMAGGCERIFKTPIPAAYTRHTSRFLMLYLTAAPILLWPSTLWLTPLVACLVAFLLLGVENIGVQIEEPFRVLPLDGICSALEANIRELQAQHAILPRTGMEQAAMHTVVHLAHAAGARAAGRRGSSSGVRYSSHADRHQVQQQHPWQQQQQQQVSPHLDAGGIGAASNSVVPTRSGAAGPAALSGLGSRHSSGEAADCELGYPLGLPPLQMMSVER